MFSQEQILVMIRDFGGSVDWHPFVETGSLGLIAELERQSLVARSNHVSGGGVLISITEAGRKRVEHIPVREETETAGQAT